MRYFIEIAYKGTNYFGWQTQPNEISVQQTLEKAMSTILRTKISIVGAGRTDTGVHASQTFAHFDLDKILPDNFLHRINRFLPKDIAVHSIKKAKEKAHARFDATSRTYSYFITTQKNPFALDTKWQLLIDELDIKKMNQAADYLTQVEDFTSFAKLHSDNKTNLCQVNFAHWKKIDSERIFTINANRFLRNMVRSIVGTLVEVGKGNISLIEFQEIIQKKDRKFAALTAPAKGLFLMEIIYPNDIFL